MRKLLMGITILAIVFSSPMFTVSAQTTTLTPTLTETVLVTTPSITVTPTLVASTSATPTKITSLPKTGIIQYGLVFFVVSIGVILFALVF